MMEWEPFGMERQFIAVGPLLSLFLSLFLILFLLFCGLMARYKNYYFYFYLFLIIICILFCCRFGLEENLTREWKRWKLVLIVYLSFYFLLFLFFHFFIFLFFYDNIIYFWFIDEGKMEQISWNDFQLMVFDSPSPKLRNLPFESRYNYLKENFTQSNNI